MNQLNVALEAIDAKNHYGKAANLFTQNESSLNMKATPVCCSFSPPLEKKTVPSTFSEMYMLSMMNVKPVIDNTAL